MDGGEARMVWFVDFVVVVVVVVDMVGVWGSAAGCGVCVCPDVWRVLFVSGVGVAGRWWALGREWQSCFVCFSGSCR